MMKFLSLIFDLALLGVICGVLLLCVCLVANANVCVCARVGRKRQCVWVRGEGEAEKKKKYFTMPNRPFRLELDAKR